jgi:hypothetical protein
MESEEEEDQEEVGMKEQRSQRRVHICKFNNGQVRMDGVLAPEDSVSRKLDMVCIYIERVDIYKQHVIIITFLRKKYWND